MVNEFKLTVVHFCMFHYAANRVRVWLEWKGTRHQWSGPEAKAGTPLTDGCLDSCYGNQCQSEALCMSHTGRNQWRREKGKAGRQRTRGNKKGRMGMTKQTACTEQAANGTCLQRQPCAKADPARRVRLHWTEA